MQQGEIETLKIPASRFKTESP